MHFAFGRWVSALLMGGSMWSGGAAAQSASPPKAVGGEDRILAEFSRSPRVTAQGNLEGWEKFEARSYTLARDEGSVQTLMGAAGSGQASAKLWFDTRSFMTLMYVQEKAPAIFSTNTDRSAQDLKPGNKWASHITYEGVPVNWCTNDLRSTFEGTFEVEPEETFNLRVDGQEVALVVLPVVERGVWKRCYSGKRYQRFLWSPELQTVVGIEFQTYNPMGKLHEASFSMRVKEIARKKD